jgi:RNA polymerase sigma factor (sigma-70 family)
MSEKIVPPWMANQGDAEIVCRIPASGGDIYVKMIQSDLELLQRFARDRAQDAFTELVNRHLNFVYSAALRQVRSPQLAEEIAQSVFTDLACQADAIRPDSALVAWLHVVTRRAAVDAIRKESRRHVREQIAAEKMNTINATEATWPDLAPLLDEAVTTLDEADRAAVLLRFFDNKSLHEVGAQLGVSDDAAQKRVSRALEKLRGFFSKRKITVGAGSLGILISANAVQAAPAGLVATISATALAGTAATTTTIISTTKGIAMTTLQKSLVTITVAIAIGAGVHEARQAAQLREQVRTLREQQAQQIRQLQSEFADATNRLADLLAENSRVKSNQKNTELLKLRGQVGVLQERARQLEKAAVQKQSTPVKMLAQMAASPEMRDMMKKAFIPSIERAYAKLFADLNLTPEQVSSLRTLIANKMTAGSIEQAKALGGGLSLEEKQQLENQFKAEKAGVDKQIQDLLGADGFAAFQACENTYYDREQIVGPSGFSSQLTGNQQLTSDQTEQLIQAMAAERQQFKFTTYFDGESLASSYDVTARLSDANISQYQKEQTQLNQLYLARTQTILTPDQQLVLQKFLADRLEQTSAGMKMTGKMMGGMTGN